MVSAAEWSIQELAKAAGTTSRTLRHYGELGLLAPSRIGRNGYRYYDQDSLVRLQRILLLRELGLSLPLIAEVLAGERDTAAALRTHLTLLEQEQQRIGRQIASVRTTLRKTEEGEPLMAAEVFDGFDHTRYREEVTERWGKQAYESGDRWWRSLTDADKKNFQQTHVDIAADYARVREAGVAVDDPQVQAIVRRHYDWVTAGWQGWQGGKCPPAQYFVNLGEMYVADPRFGKNYGGLEGATYVRDAMAAFAATELR
ncbi:MerR family transcriptional regulator [Nocardia stercoris]|uniref:MerR family transcriptional regulator n=1 Tax=Nocardia stercoris TaxID=2483361 RepID=A0A3M2LBV8_9NOCA|nr:MerR family transcriptional regulator [Nocardia stercoris]RMI34200.1 MerR family transcriptional regulator [Nocardia stercoris]